MMTTHRAGDLINAPTTTTGERNPLALHLTILKHLRELYNGKDNEHVWRSAAKACLGRGVGMGYATTNDLVEFEAKLRQRVQIKRARQQGGPRCG